MSERRPDPQHQPTRSQPTTPTAGSAAGAPRPRYEPPRLARKRSVARVTLASNNFGGAGPTAGGLTGPG